MGTRLFTKFLEEEVYDLIEALAYHGIVGVLEQYEQWLYNKGYLEDLYYKGGQKQ